MQDRDVLKLNLPKKTYSFLSKKTNLSWTSTN